MAISANAQRRLSIALGDPAASQTICDAIDTATAATGNANSAWSYVSSYLVGALATRVVSSKAVLADLDGFIPPASLDEPTLYDATLACKDGSIFMDLAYTSDTDAAAIGVNTKTSKVVTSTTRGAAAHALRVTVGNTTYKLLLYAES